MPKPHVTILRNEIVRDVLKHAWDESEPGTANAHEEGDLLCVRLQESFR